jgi:hypothetical protein
LAAAWSRFTHARTISDGGLLLFLRGRKECEVEIAFPCVEQRKIQKLRLERVSGRPAGIGE